MAKLLSASQILSIHHCTIQMEGGWYDCLGAITRTGVVFIWGNSGNGKSSAVMSFAKELTKHGKVLYVSLEEGFSLSFQNTLRRYSMQDCSNSFQAIREANIDAISERLEKRRSADFVIIDSFQYTRLNFDQYLKFKQRHSNKLLIFVSHADGKRPYGRTAVRVKYDADLKIWVEGYKAISNGRYIGPTGEYIIWEEGARRYCAPTNKKDNED